MKIRMYGTRGITPAPGVQSSRYGGNTSCIALRLEDSNDLMIIDAGTGIIKLGQELVSKPTPYNIKLFITHIHMDHIQGFPFFLPLYNPENNITIYYPKYEQASLEKILNILANEYVNPVHLGKIKAQIRYEHLQENIITLKTLRIKNIRVNHPILTLGFRFEHRGKVLCVITDHEPESNLKKNPNDTEKYILSDIDYGSFIEHSDLLIADAQYLPEEVKLYAGWGHANINYIVNQCIKSSVGRVVLTHHDPNRTDLQIDTIVDHYRTLITKKGLKLEIVAAREIEEYSL
ncbi:MAG: MBL fold metallo-hydrolase [Spirochaetia bacterium]|nr:MBL fold metallo-hydrolase [Spirochaetia bacterium]